MKIVDLLKNMDYTTWIQGNHTRMLLSGVLFEVLSRGPGKGSSYNHKHYEGYDEEEAVASFMESEDT